MRHHSYAAASVPLRCGCCTATLRLLRGGLDGLLGDDDDLWVGFPPAGERVAVSGGNGGGAGGTRPVAQFGDTGVTLVRHAGVVQVDVDNALGLHAGKGAFLDEQRAVPLDGTTVVGDTVLHGGGR